MSMPLSTSTTTNEYIDSINSEFSFQLAEMTVFQFPNSDQRKFQIIFLTNFHQLSANIKISVTISCEIGLSPKQSINQYKLSALYGQCDIPSRSSSRKRRSEPEDEDVSKISISKTIKISKKSNQKSSEFQKHTFALSLVIIAMFLL